MDLNDLGRQPLPMLEVVPAMQCPAARRVHGAERHKNGVVCGVMENDRRKETGVGMDSIQLAVARGKGRDDQLGGALMTVTSDPSTIENLCGGTQMPVIGPLSVQGNRAHYTYCSAWQAEKLRIEDEREMLKGGGTAERAAQFSFPAPTITQGAAR